MSRIIRGETSNDGYRNFPNLEDLVVEGDEESSDIPCLREMTVEFLIQCTENEETNVGI